MILWIVLAVLFLVLALISFFYGKGVKKELKEYNAGSHLSLESSTPTDVPMNDLVYKAFRLTSITNLIGFILASVAALISALLF